MRFCLWMIQCAGFLLLFYAQMAFSVGVGVVGSKHDLSVTNPYPDVTNYGATTEVCVFCHTPHDSNIDLNQDGLSDQSGTSSRAPLWNRKLTDASKYTTYTSDTMNASPHNPPSPLSLACLSCHDGTVAQSVTNNNPSAVSGNDIHNVVNPSNLGPVGLGNTQPDCRACHGRGDADHSYLPGRWWQIGADLSNDHPISITYSDALVTDPDFFNVPPSSQSGWSDVRLFRGRVECPSCHNPHSRTNTPFLRKTIAGSALCFVCHNK